MLDSVGAFAASVGSSSHQMGRWLIDLGASNHMTNYKEFDKAQKVSKSQCGGGQTLDALGVGEVHVKTLWPLSYTRTPL